MGSLRSLRSDSKEKPTMDEVVAHIYQKRKNREEWPKGRYDKGGRWYPDEDEKCGCCHHIRSPSRAWPHSLREHCRTKKHVRSLVKKIWDEPKERRRLINKVKSAAVKTLTTVVRVVRGIYLSVQEWVRNLITKCRAAN